MRQTGNAETVLREFVELRRLRELHNEKTSKQRLAARSFPENCG
jgi:hypothetical protein